jgi:ribonuclease Z
MKPSFHHNLVNGPFEDPLLYVRLFWQRRALLFDIGDISALEHRSILKVSDVFVTHAHIDHFIGFDALLRAHLGSERPLRVFGPSNITDCIEGKLKGYAWNVIEQYPLKLEVFGIGEDTMSHTSFYAPEAFKRIDRGEKPLSDGVVLEDEFFKVRAVSLRHDIQCLGYTLEEDYHINIDKAALTEKGLPVGRWLAELKGLIREGAPDDTKLDVLDKTIPLRELKGLAMITKGQKISYVMDAEPNDENIEKIIDLVRGSNTLYCEAYFMEADRDRARERHHLTARLAGRIAREGCIDNLVVTHFSPKYRGSESSPEQEAMEEFKGGQ